MKDFSTKIKRLRKQTKETQQDIANLLGVQRSTYGEYERGKILPPFNKIKILANHFGVSVDYFVTGNDSTKETEIDVSKQLQAAIQQLKNAEELSFDGKPLDDDSRQLLIDSIENGLKMAFIISKSKGK